MSLTNQEIDLRTDKELPDWGNYSRPKMRFTIDPEPYNDGCHIHISIYEQIGQPTRYIELNAYEALKIAAQLAGMANKMDDLVVEAKDDAEAEAAAAQEEMDEAAKLEQEVKLDEPSF